jgi:hypothetical protein
MDFVNVGEADAADDVVEQNSASAGKTDDIAENTDGQSVMPKEVDGEAEAMGYAFDSCWIGPREKIYAGQTESWQNISCQHHEDEPSEIVHEELPRHMGSCYLQMRWGVDDEPRSAGLLELIVA